MTDGRANRPRRRRPADESHVGARLATARIAAGLTQSALADVCAVSVRTVQRWETGEAQPRIDDLAAAARACGVVLAELVTW